MRAWMVGLVALAGCGAAQAGAGAGSTTPAAAPLIGTGGDAADHACNVVLREVHPVRDTSGAMSTDCSGRSSCWYIWQGTLDVSNAAAAEGDSPSVLFQVNGQGSWLEVDSLEQSAGAGPGFTRYSFTLSQDTLQGGDATALANLKLALIPFVHTAQGGRLFDHNRVAGDLDSYVLDAADDYAVAADASVCAPQPATPTIAFQGQTITQTGAVIAGGQVQVSYDLRRMPGCFSSTYNGLEAWNTQAYARFTPGGETAQATVSGNPPAQLPDGGFSGVPATFSVPADATGMQLWFENSGDHCTTSWDSNYGANWSFEVLPKAPAPVAWAGNWGGSMDRSCTHVDGLSDPLSVTSLNLEQTCMFADAEVWVPGLTDDPSGEHPEAIWAEAEVSRDGAAPTYVPLSYQGRVGNNYRYRWDFPRQQMQAGGWSAYTFAFRFSTDGVSWYRIGTGDGPSGGDARTIENALDR